MVNGGGVLKVLTGATPRLPLAPNTLAWSQVSPDMVAAPIGAVSVILLPA
jgi:hypothetical protein